MTKQELQRKLRANYNRDRWKEVLLEMFPEANLFAQDRPTVFTREEQRNLANHIVQFGEVELNGDKLIFLEVELKPDSVQLTRNRVGLRKLVDNEVIAGLTDGALISYYQPETDEWRITFYSERYGWDEDGNTIKEETHPKRYTYVVGPAESCKTAAGQLIKVVQKASENTLEHVLKAFSVQKVSKEFFKEYKEQYDKFVGHLTGKIWTNSGVKDVGNRISQFHFFFKATSDHEKEARDFVKKLLGRIVFLYFVQKKQWLGADSTDFKDGKPDFIYDLFKQVPEDKKDQFYSKWLTKLFFDTLNRDDDHAFEMPDGTTVYIPFLNGGLFEKDETDHNTESLPLPGELFSNPEDTESPNTRGFLDFLSAYNFTIHEDSPGDHTIAVDPEMLGHIFENLLEDNKDKGAYYTPKPIVHYMCQESLIEYLLTELTAEKAEDAEKEELRGHLENFIKNQEGHALTDYVSGILESLRKVKVCDPAIGSGAFPMGILQEIYQAVETFHHLQPDEVMHIWELPDDDWHPAEVKKQIIQNSIYGVDIEKGAVDIARLRFWLSLIVDEEEPTALPNLDYKIVVGDSLVSKLVLNGQEKVVEINWEVKESVGKAKEHVENLRQTLDAIVNKQKEFFEADNEAKNELREVIKKLKIDALIYQLKYDREYYSQKTIVKGGMMPSSADKEHNLTREIHLKEYTKLIEELQKVKSITKPVFQHFEWTLDFPEILNPAITDKQGFDLIIGNPPYVNVEKFGKGSDYIKSIQTNYSSIWQDKSDLLFYFISRAINLTNGLITFIVSNAFLFSDKAKKLRKEIYENAPIKKLINFERYMAFENAMITSAIILLSKNSNLNSTSVLNLKEEKFDNTDFSSLVSDKDLFFDAEFEPNKVFALIDNQIAEINSKIDSNHPKLGDILKVGSGMQTGANKIYCSEKVKKLTGKYIKGHLKGNSIKRYYIDEKKSGSILYVDDVNKFNDLPQDIKKYLNDNKKTLENRADKKRRKTAKWWTYTFAMHKELYEYPKIWTSYRSSVNCFALDESSNFIGLTNTTVIFDTCPERLNIKYVLAVLNSSLMNFRYRSIGKQTGGGLFEYFKNGISKMPIKIIDLSEQVYFASLIDFILFSINNDKNKHSKLFERVLDAMVTEIYLDEHLKELEICVFDLIKNDIDDFFQGAKKDQLNKSQINSIANNLYDLWSQPENEIISRINKFQEKSPMLLNEFIKG